MVSMFLMYYLSLSLSFMFLCLNTPILISLNMALISLLLTFIMSNLHSIWYGMIFFLVYLGGILVLMIYICMLSSNLKLELKLSIISLFLLSCSASFLLSNTIIDQLKNLSWLSVGFGPMYLPTWSLPMIGLVLLLIFVGISSMIFVGGRGLKVEF
uniref:NADH dehydrogenase subunit 6 n=1 Tax=Euglandina singleyana TaxID=169637 RepID=UPI002551FCA5|nr:NADH dehydrogenase subunit 6 [Euglandina singleyana]WFQ82716.1 NADH dehydrogenase subunit 6 [Euglandina singleyana]